MLFNSLEFLVYLLIVLIAYHGFLRRASWRTVTAFPALSTRCSRGSTVSRTA